MEPTDRSMPPVTITGVRARASSPSSTPRRTISKAFTEEKKFGPVSVKTAISIRIRMPSVSSLPARFSTSTGRNLFECDGTQDDRALDGFFPEGVHAEECQRRRDGGEDGGAEQGAPEGALSASDGRAADYDG